MYPDAPTTRALLLEVGGHVLALGARDARQVVALESTTPVPRSSPVLLGLIAVRGRIVPLVDLAALLGLEGVSPGERQGERAVLAGDGEEVFAFPVGDVLGFVQLGVTPAAPGALTAPATEHGGRAVSSLQVAAIRAALAERITVV